MKSKFISAVMAVVMALSMSTVSFAADFKDTVNIPQSEAIDVIETLGVVSGYGDDVFGPNDILTRAQLCTMLTRALYGDPIYISTNQFKDVPAAHWASPFINTASAYGLMAGYGDGLFGPEDEITYTQMAAVIMKSLGYDCGKMSWPAGINSMAHTLGLFDDVKFTNYNDGCTRANAAQMIYNAFELNFVNHKADYPVIIKNKTFLKDGLGFEETIEIIDGHKFVAYIDLNDDEVYVTENCLTYEKAIYPIDGFNFHFKGSSKSHVIDWNWLTDKSNVVLYVNGTEITSDSEKLFADCEKATGVFDEDDNLMAIYIDSIGKDFIYDVMPDIEIHNVVKNDKDFDPETSTVTYFDETGDYVISNKINFGWVTDAYKSIIYVDGVKIVWDNAAINFEKNDFVKMFYNYRGEIVAIIEVENPYVYDMTDGIYHTSECDTWNDFVNHHFHNFIEEIKDCVDCDEDIYEFEACRYCHAKTGPAHNGKDITIVK